MKKQRKFLLKLLFFSVTAILLLGSISVSAATQTGFITLNGKSYYINKDGSKQKGWLELNGKKYYFDKNTGVQLKGWARDSDGKAIRYFTNGDGHMVTGFLTDTSGKTRYFDPQTGLLTRGWLTDEKGYKYYFYSNSGVMAKGWLQNNKEQKRYFRQSDGRMCTGWVKSSSGNYRYFKASTGIMYTGLQKVDNDYYYFSKTSGVRYQKGFGTVSGKKYYFAPGDGKMKTGWLTLNGKKYYFTSSGVMLVSTTTSVDGKTYKFDSNGVATETTPIYQESGNYVKVYDAKNGKYYYMEKQFLQHPGIADGTVSDLELLAAVCDAEAGNQGLVGMEAVALCILNSTIDTSKGFPSEIRYVVYQGKPTQYAVVTDGSLLKRLNGHFSDRTNAYAAAKAAMKIFNNYVTKGTKRVLTGFKTKDFKYKYFMTPAAFKAQHLNFSKLEYEQYQDHVFFVDWIVG